MSITCFNLLMQKKISDLHKGLQKDNPILEIWGLPVIYLLEAKNYSFYLAGCVSNR